MSGRTLLLVHAALGTLAILVARLLEEAAVKEQLPQAAVMSVTYIVIFAILLGLEASFDYFQKERRRRLEDVGLVEGCWVERSTLRDMGSFIEIGYSAEKGFKITGTVFDPAGRELGRYEGHGEAKTDGRTLHYHYTGDLREMEDSGSGNFTFHDPRNGRATAFDGSFYGRSSKAVREVKGKRVDDLPQVSEDQKNNVKKLTVTTYLREQ